MEIGQNMTIFHYKIYVVPTINMQIIMSQKQTYTTNKIQIPAKNTNLENMKMLLEPLSKLTKLIMKYLKQYYDATKIQSTSTQSKLLTYDLYMLSNQNSLKMYQRELIYNDCNVTYVYVYIHIESSVRFGIIIHSKIVTIHLQYLSIVKRC